jgi:hypothetical protein
MAMVRRPKPISVVEARRLYEQTNLPVDHIAAMHGMTRHPFYRRIHKWGWRMRRPLVPATDPPREPDELSVLEPGQEQPLSEIAATAERIRRAVEQELAAVEQAISQLTPQATAEAECAARTLASLARTLQEVARLNAQCATPHREENDEDRGPDDPDEFLLDLARRMDAFAASRIGSGLPAPGEQGTD